MEMWPGLQKEIQRLMNGEAIVHRAGFQHPEACLRKWAPAPEISRDNLSGKEAEETAAGRLEMCNLCLVVNIVIWWGALKVEP